MTTNVPGGVHVAAGTQEGRHVRVGRLAHGEHPEGLLARAGWHPGAPRSVARVGEGLEITYAARAVAQPSPRDVVDAVRRDPGIAPDAVGVPYQRVAAYAVVTGPAGVLLTQFNARTHSEAHWGLPGGGLDPGEDPAAAVLREVWEETGQDVVLGGLLAVQSDRWIGRSPSGRLEDFHAVRLVYEAVCPRPGQVVVHDVGGTTADARWVSPAQLPAFPLTRSWRGFDALTRLAGASRPGPD